MSELPDKTLLDSLGIDSQEFYDYAKPCDSEHKFQTAVSECTVKCQLHGKHIRHKAIFHGYPMEWD